MRTWTRRYIQDVKSLETAKDITIVNGSENRAQDLLTWFMFPTSLLYLDRMILFLNLKIQNPAFHLKW